MCAFAKRKQEQWSGDARDCVKTLHSTLSGLVLNNYFEHHGLTAHTFVIYCNAHVDARHDPAFALARTNPNLHGTITDGANPLRSIVFEPHRRELSFEWQQKKLGQTTLLSMPIQADLHPFVTMERISLISAE